ncbi:hypothetical protein [Streptomyces sp. NBC_01216]|uniref:hypothetical protein n=1 Tax=unclassified Streptomyces TaxID=2593676 RepID=UPI002E13EF22
MSGTENRRRGRGSLLIASVSAGVLLAGGGGVYLATTASEGDGGASDAAAGREAGSPPPLRLDAKNAGDDPGPGIAPGEPDPHGGGAVYEAEGPLPQGPSSAAVHRSEGRVTAAEVTRLAKALGLAGTPALRDGVWRIAPEKDGSGLRLEVAEEAPGSWTFSRYDGGPVGDSCLKGPACPPPGEAKPSRGGTPVSEAAAKAAAAPVLKAIGQDDAKVDATQLMGGSVRVVNAEPVVGGLPTYGWSTGVHVGPDGSLVAGSGQLKEPAKGAVYPVIGAGKALDELNEASSGPGRHGIGGCATDPPARTRADGGPEAGPDGAIGTDLPCTPAPRPVLKVTGAVFGLASQYVDGERALVPSWFFTVEPAAGARPYSVVRTAVAAEYLAPPAKPSPPEGTAPARRIESYRVDAGGTKLSVTFWGGVCSDYTVSAGQSADSVTVGVTERPVDPGRACVAMAVEVTRTVTLDRPLAGRTVTDAASGEQVPAR